MNGIGTFESRRKQPRVDPKKRTNERFNPNKKKEPSNGEESENEEIVTTIRPRKTREWMISSNLMSYSNFVFHTFTKEIF